MGPDLPGRPIGAVGSGRAHDSREQPNSRDKCHWFSSNFEDPQADGRGRAETTRKGESDQGKAREIQAPIPEHTNAREAETQTQTERTQATSTKC